MCVSSYSRRCACHLECCLQSSWTVDHQHPICMHTGHTAARAVARWTSRHGSRSASNRLYFVTRLQGAPAARGPALRHSQHNKPRAHSLATAAATGPAMATAGAAPEQIASNKCCGGYNKRLVPVSKANRLRADCQGSMHCSTGHCSKLTQLDYVCPDAAPGTL